MEQVLYPLPDGWKYQKLKSLVKMHYGKALKAEDRIKGDVPVFGSNGIVGSHNQWLWSEPTVVIGRKGSVGEANLSLTPSWTIDTAYYVEIIDQKVLDLMYFYYFADRFDVSSISQKGVKPGINRNDYLDLNFPLPPIIEQKRIVEKLDALLIRIGTAIEHLQESLTLADALFASVLDELVTGVDGKKIKLGELGKIIRGSSPRPKGDQRYYGGSVPRLMVADVTRDGRYVTPTIDFLTDEGALKSRPVPKGTLTIQVSGNPGMPAILAVDACIHDGFAAIVEINQERISTEYLYFSLLAVAKQNNQMAVGAIFRNLTTSQLRGIEVVIPSHEKQLEMVKQMDIADQKVKVLKAELSSQLDAIYRLKASILDSAFKGEL